MRIFKDRRDAGRYLSERLKQLKGQDCVVYGLPRGGVVVADEIAHSLNAPLDLLFAHKIGHPYHAEYAVAAVSEDGHLLESSRELLDKRWLESQKKIQLEEIQRKRNAYLKDRSDHPVKDKIAIVVDDGIATGLTMRVAIEELKARQPQKIIVAVPVTPKSTADLLRKSGVDEVIGMEIPEGEFLGAVGAYYRDFSQTEDAEVLNILDKFYG